MVTDSWSVCHEFAPNATEDRRVEELFRGKSVEAQSSPVGLVWNFEEGVPAQGLGSNLGEDMDVCKFIVPLWHGGTLNIRRAASPLVRLLEREERWEPSDHLQGVLPLNWGGNEPNRTVTCMVLKATANDRRHLELSHDEFRGPRSGLCRSGGISNNNNNRLKR
ncbi:uncharacterized protein TNCV_2310681 [Trichonephila clavipes]|nr:uncharacterized protein TNCV_2310681 [Trichonephila clavipes]